MAEDPKKIRQLADLENERIELARERIALSRQEYDTIRASYDKAYQQQQIEQNISENKELQAAYQEEINNLKDEEHVDATALNNELNNQKQLHQDIEKEQRKQNKNWDSAINKAKQLSAAVQPIWNYLMDSDKAIKQTIVSLGMSGAKADEMRASFELSAMHVAQMGGSLADIQTIMTGYADETGRARALSAEMVESVVAIGRGTGLGVEQATKLTAQFELMGFNAKNAMDYAEGVVETAELMGVNTTKVLREISENFRRLQRYTFVQGVRGMAEMASYAEKFHMDISQALDAAETARTLEGAVDLAAQLQVMGGEFAKTDPFQMLYLARNAPEEFAKKINQMTTGIATFRKNADGALETFISPVDLDRLAQVEKSLGMQAGELSQQARRMAEIQRMRQRMVGMGLTKEEQTLIEGLYTFDNKLDRFTVQIGGAARDVTKLGAEQLEQLKNEKESLEDRAKRAQTFDEAWKATIESLKSILLPMLQGVNKILEKIRPVVENWTETVDGVTKTVIPGWLKVVGGLMAVGTVFMRGILPIFQKVVGAVGWLRGWKPPSMGVGQARATRAGAARTAARGKAGMMGGAGIGAAALGVGAGIGAAASGISLLADSMSKLDEDQAQTLKEIIKTLGIAIGVIPALTVAMLALSPAVLAAAPALYTLGGAIALIGTGVGVAAAGIGVMGMGFAKMEKSGANVAKSLFQVGAGITAIGAGLALAGPAAVFGLPALALTLKTISKRADDLKALGEGLAPLTMLSGMKEDFIAIENMVNTISAGNLENLKNFSALKDLKDIFSKPLEVKFSDKEVNMVSNITLNIDGYKFVEAIGIENQLIHNEEDARKGKRALKG